MPLALLRCAEGANRLSSEAQTGQSLPFDAIDWRTVVVRLLQMSEQMAHVGAHRGLIKRAPICASAAEHLQGSLAEHEIHQELVRLIVPYAGHGERRHDRLRRWGPSVYPVSRAGMGTLLVVDWQDGQSGEWLIASITRFYECVSVLNCSFDGAVGGCQCQSGEQSARHRGLPAPGGHSVVPVPG